MYSVHLIYNGKIFPAQVTQAKAEYVELLVKEPEQFKLGDYISFLDLNRKLEMRIIHMEGSTLSLYPSNSDIFLINTATPTSTLSSMSQDERRKYIRFNVDTSARLHEMSEDFHVHVVDISRQGIGFVSNRQDLAQTMEFDVDLICQGEVIHPRVVIRNRIPMEFESRYGAEIIFIDPNELHALRYFIVMQQLKMMG